MRARTRSAAAERGKSWRSLVALLVLVAFAAQSFLVQTHVHKLPLPIASAGNAQSVSAPHEGKAPLDTDKCLFCQEYTHAGAYVTPAVASALPPMMAVGVIALAAAPFLAAKPISHIWIGRAPPRA